MEKKMFTPAEVRALQFKSADIITTSGEGFDNIDPTNPNNPPVNVKPGEKPIQTPEDFG